MAQPCLASDLKGILLSSPTSVRVAQRVARKFIQLLITSHRHKFLPLEWVGRGHVETPQFCKFNFSSSFRVQSKMYVKL